MAESILLAKKKKTSKPKSEESQEDEDEKGSRKSKRLAAERGTPEGRKSLHHSRATAAKLSKKAKSRTPTKQSPVKPARTTRGRPKAGDTKRKPATKTTKEEKKGKEKDKEKDKEKEKQDEQLKEEKPKRKRGTSTKEDDDEENTTKQAKATTKSKPAPAKADEKSSKNKSKDSDKDEASTDSNDWTKQEVTALTEAYNNPKNQGNRLWELVARAVPNKTMQECYDKFHAAYPTPKNRKQEPKLKKEAATKMPALEDASQLGGKGTNKRKRMLRNLNKMENIGHVDDAFNATPLIGKHKRFVVEISEDERDIDDIFSSQQSEPPEKWSEPNGMSNGKEETLLKTIDFDKVDKYSKTLMKIGHESRGNRKSSNSKKASEPTATRADVLANMKKDAEKLAKYAKQREGESDTSLNESSVDYYYSDASDEV